MMLNLIKQIENYFKETSLWGMWQKYFEFAPLLKKIKFETKKPRLLQFGYFSSLFSNELAEFFSAKEYIIVDSDKDNITQAELNNTSSSRVIYQKANPVKTNFPAESFDVVCIFDFLYRQKDWRKVVLEARRVLKPQGKLIIKDKSVESFAFPGVGLVLRQINELPVAYMFDQVEFLTYLKKNGFVIDFDYDSLFSLEVVATKSQH